MEEAGLCPGLLQEGVFHSQPTAQQSKWAAWHGPGFSKNLSDNKAACTVPLPSWPCHSTPSLTSLPTARLQQRGEGRLLHSPRYKEELPSATSARCRELPDREVTASCGGHDATTRALSSQEDKDTRPTVPCPILSLPCPKGLCGWPEALGTSAAAGSPRTCLCPPCPFPGLSATPAHGSESE